MKKIISLMISLVICLGIVRVSMVPSVAAKGDEIRAAKKIISVVYDDSGSMFGDRWVYANYAMQALTALLNEQDELYITYMSRPTSSAEIELKDLKAAVKGIRNWNHSADTPEESLDTAKAALDSISESDVSTQFWLVIMTDGSINNMDETMQQKLDSFKGARMSNNSILNVVYLAMGSGAVPAASDKASGLHTFEAEDLAAITTTMSDIANLVSGRITADNVKQVDEKTISFNSSLPLYSISVLSQQSSASVASAESPEQKLTIDRNIGLDAFEPFGSTDTTLYGNAAVINLTDSAGIGQVIQSGTYTITFSEAVDVKDLVVQYEPAIGLKMFITREGTVIDDPANLIIDDKVSIEIVPVIPGTDEKIDSSSLPKGITWNIEYAVDDQPIASEKGSKLSGVTIRKGRNVILGTMQVPGFAPSVFEISFPVVEIIYNFGIQVDQPDSLTYYRKSAGDGSTNGSSVIFWITNDGIPLTKEQQKDLGIGLTVTSVSCDDSAINGFFHRFGNILAECDLKRNDDGSYTLSPTPVAPFTAFLMKAGFYTVTVSLSKDDTITAIGTFNMVPQMSDWIDLGILVLIVLILLYLFYIIFIKYKFKGQTVCYKVYKMNGEGGGTELVNESNTKYLSPLTLDLLLPKRACEIKFYGLTLRAGPDGSVMIPGRSIARRVTHYKASSNDPVTSLHSIVASMRPTRRPRGKKTEYNANDEFLGKRPIYFRTHSTDSRIWRLNLRH